MLRQLTDIGHPRYLRMDGQCQPPPTRWSRVSSAAPAFRVTGICPGPKLSEYVKNSHAVVVTDVGTKIQRYGLMLRDES